MSLSLAEGLTMKIPTPELCHLTSADYEHVYEPAEDTFLVLDALEADGEWLAERRPTVCLEVGSGSGCISTFLGKVLGASSCVYFTTDVNARAADCTLRTGNHNGVGLNAVVCDLTTVFTARLRHQVDVLLFNPPYVPTPPEEMHSTGIEASWAGGVDGREVLDRLLPHVRSLLSARGVFYLVAVKENDPEGIIDELGKFGLEGKTVYQRKAGREFLSILRFVVAARSST